MRLSTQHHYAMVRCLCSCSMQHIRGIPDRPTCRSCRPCEQDRVRLGFYLDDIHQLTHIARIEAFPGTLKHDTDMPDLGLLSSMSPSFPAMDDGSDVRPVVGEKISHRDQETDTVREFVVVDYVQSAVRGEWFEVRYKDSGELIQITGSEMDTIVEQTL